MHVGISPLAFLKQHFPEGELITSLILIIFSLEVKTNKSVWQP